MIQTIRVLYKRYSDALLKSTALGGFFARRIKLGSGVSRPQIPPHDNHGFWKDLPKGFCVLAPMADVTDVAFRRMIAKYSRMGAQGGGPAVMWTEFVSADGLASKGREVLLRDLAFTENERPIVAQLFTSKPENMKFAAHLVASLGFDGIDINMGCPDKSIEKQGSGAAHIKNPELAQKVIRAAQEGALEYAQEKSKETGTTVEPIPVSVKTRVGYNKVELETWIPKILDMNIANLTIHARTRKEMSNVPARWEHVARSLEIRNNHKVRNAQGELVQCTTRIIGNGDVTSLAQAHDKIKQTGCDGVMIGRGIFGSPWFFDSAFNAEHDLTIRRRLEIMLEHTRLFMELLGDIKNFALMKKHYKAYVHGWHGAKELRIKLMEAQSVQEIEGIVAEYCVNEKDLVECTLARAQHHTHIMLNK